MPVNYNVTPFGGFQLGQGIDKVFSGLEGGRQKRADKKEARRLEDIFTDEQSQKNMGTSMMQFLSGEKTADEVTAARADWLIKQGKDPADTLAFGQMEPEEQHRRAKAALMRINPAGYQMLFPQQNQGKPNPDIQKFEYWKNLPEGREKDAMGRMLKLNADDKAKGKTQFKMGTGSMTGSAFNPDTGEYTIDPEIKQALDDKARSIALEGKDLTVTQRQSINKDVTGLLKDASLISKAAVDLSKLKERSSPTSQLAAVFKLMKALDPTSVVREGEQDQARSTGGAADSLVGYVNKLLGSGALPPKVFADMMNTAKTLANSQIDFSNNELSSYLDTYEDTLSPEFKNRLLKRIPSRFDSIVAFKPDKKIITSKVLGREISEQDIQDTLEASPGLTREELLLKLGA